MRSQICKDDEYGRGVRVTLDGLEAAELLDALVKQAAIDCPIFDELYSHLRAVAIQLR